MSNRLKAGKHLLLSCSALFPVLFAGVVPVQAQAVNLGGAGNLIVPDGRTETNVSSAGATTDIRTNTVRGQTGYNSFSRFEAGSGNTVNLHLPNGTGTLVNVVRDAPVVVEGTVNALKNGSIGGNVVFSDPYGFVLGKGGVINTGGLTVNTPTKEFLDQAIDAHGRIDTSKTDRLISGDVPLSPDGSVVIRGRVNAETHIDIHAQSIDVDGEAVLKRHRENFEASVNTSGGVAQGGALVVRNGRISLVAAGDVKIGGSVAARATSRASAKAGAGRVAIKARNVTVTPTARIEALAEIAREGGGDAVAATIGIEASGLLDIAGTLEARGLRGAGAAVNLGADRAALKASALLSAQIEAGGPRAVVGLTAANDIALDGRIEARGASGTKGGLVGVEAGRDIAMGSTSAVDASGEGDSAGGDIHVVATRDLSVADGTSVVARGAGHADGGFAELSGHRAVTLGAVAVDLRSAGAGQAGTLLIDPTDLVFDTANPTRIQSNLALTATNAITVKSGGSIRSGVDNGKAYDISLEAKTITVENGGVIDSRALDANGNVNGASGSITLSASTIRLLAGSTVRADAGPGFAAGTVTLLASDATFQRSGAATATARIEIAGSLYGADVKALAVARATSIFNETDVLNPNFSLSVMDGVQAALLVGRIAGMPALDGGFLSGTTVARVDVASTADIVATGDLSLQAVGQQAAANLGIDVTTGSKVQLTAFYGTVDADTAVTVASGARLSTLGDLTITARNSAVLDVNAMSVGLKDTPISGAFAMGVAKIRTQARIAAGAIVKVDKDTRIAADNLNSFSVVSTVMALKDGVAGAAIAIQDADASATASLNAGIAGYTSAKTGSVSVTALSETTLNKTGASTDLGDNFVQKPLRDPLSGIASKVAAKLPTLSDFLFKNTPFAALSQDAMPKGGVGLSLMFGQQAATAEIGSGVVLDLSGNLAVVSSVLDAQVRSNATASINTTKTAEQGPKTTTGVGIAVAYADVDHVSHATIGNGASITAANVGVSATSSLPINITYVNNAPPSTPVEWIKAIVSHANGKLGVVKNVLTSYAASDVEAEEGLGATLNYLGIGHDVLSWIGSGASITTTGTGTADWTTASLAIDPSTDSRDVPRLSTGTIVTRVPAVTFKAGVDVAAHSSTETINIAGNPAWFLVVGGNASTDTDTGKSFGGSVNLNVFSARTVAGIGAGARIVSARDLRVLSERADTVFSVTPTSGKGGGFGINGILSVLMVANETSASISEKAVVEAKAVSVEADQRNKIVSISGSLNRSSGTSVGIAANWTNIDTDTLAFVGDNASLVAGTALANGGGLPAGSIRSTGVAVRAATSGDTYGLSVAGAMASPDDGEKGKVAKARDKISNAILPRYARVDSSKKPGGALSKLADTLKGGLAKLSAELAAPAPVGQSRDFSMSAAGSVSGATITATTDAYLDGATLISVAGAAYPVSVKATNDSLISVTSGGASLALSGQTAANKSAAVAGAVAIAVTDGATRAAIRNSILTDVATSEVLAIASGQQIVIGLGLSVNTNAGAANTLAIAGSVSVGLVFDNVNASIENSVLTAKAGANADLAVKAYQNTDIGIGGLAISVATSGSGGYGLAISGTVIADSADPTNPDDRKAVSARILNSSVSNVRDVTVDAATLSRVMSGAAAIGAAPNGLGVSGSIVFNDISGTTLALIQGRGATDRIAASGSVLVRSGSVREASIESVLSSVVRNTAVASGFDFSRNTFDADSSGAVIFALSAAGAGGKNAGGVALLYNGVRHAHTARIEGVDLRAGGDVTVAAKDDTKIIGTAVGVSVATGDFGGAGSIVIEVIANKTDASIKGAGTVLAARDIAVLSSNTSEIKGGAGALGVGLSAQGTGLGLSLINGTVANRTTATIEAATLVATRDVDLAATSKADILTFSVNVGVGNAAGIAGSVTLQVSANDAVALARGASIRADNNVSVAASNEDAIQVTAGAVGVSLQGAGVGVSTTVNIVRGDTVAGIQSFGGVASSVVARGQGTAKTVDNGKVLTAYDLGGAAATANTLIALTPVLANGTRSVSGLSVNAVSRQKVGSASLSVGIGRGIAVAVNPILNVLGGTTDAHIVDAAINRTGSANDKADVAVIAASNTFVQNGLLTVAGSGGGAGAGGLSSNTMQRVTTASVLNAMVGGSDSVGALAIEAGGTMTSVNLVAGMAVGSGGAAGSAVLNLFDATTRAELSGGEIRAGSAAVRALTNSAFLGAAGAGAGGGSAGAGAMNLAFNLGSTRAVVGSVDTVVVLGEDMTVEATSRDDHRAYVVGAAVGTGGFAVAGMLNLSALLSDTIASVQNLRASSMRDLTITARNEIELRPVTGGFALSAGSVGVGAAVNIMLTKSTVAAELLNSDVTVRRELGVKSYGVRKSEMVTATLGAGASAGIGASVGILVAGIGMSDEAKAELGDTLTSANDQSNQSASGSFGGTGTAAYRGDQPEAGTATEKASDPDSLRRQNLVSGAISSTKRDGVTARIAGTGVVLAGTTTVLADSRIESSNTAYGIGIGGNVGVGAALGFTFVNQAVSASVDLHDTGAGASFKAGRLQAGSLTVSALSGKPGTSPAVVVKSYAGAGSLGGALGAAVAIGRIDSDVGASVGGSVSATGDVAVSAKDETSIESEAVGATVAGGVALGISVAKADRNAGITASVRPNAAIGQASGVSVTASSTGSASANGIAGAGGLFGAGVGASGLATETSRVTALIGEGSQLAQIGANGVVVAASAQPHVRANSIGVAVGGNFAVGASVAIAEADATVRALVARTVSIGTTGLFSVTADLLKTNAEPVYATSRAGSGSLFLAAQASVAQARSTGLVEAALGDDVDVLTTSGVLTVKARSATRQRADVTGIAVSGGLALGATVAEATSDMTTNATIGARSRITGLDLSVSADGTDENVANAVSGAGGLIAGSAAAVKTATVSRTTASVGAGNATDKIALIGKLAVSAGHLGVIGGSVDSIQAALVGASGAIATHFVDSQVGALVGDDAVVEAADLEVAAVNRTHRLFRGESGVDLRTSQPTFNGDTADWSLNSGSGGIVNLPAGSSRMTVSQVTKAVIGKNALVRLSPVGVNAKSTADLSAYNELIVHDKVKLDSGGAIALADTRTYLDVTRNTASVVFDDGSRLVAPNGDIRAAAFDNAHLDLRAASTTYGIAGAPSGTAEIAYNRSNLVRVSRSALVEANNLAGGATGTIKLSAGADLVGKLSKISANATIDLFNNTLIPIPTIPNPTVLIAGDSVVSVEGDGAAAPAAGTGVRAAGDISITASRGEITARAVGTGKDLYRESLAAVASAVSGLFGGGAVSFDYKGGETRVSGLGIASVNGIVETGINRTRELTVSYASASSSTCLINIKACLIDRIPGQIGYTFTGDIAVGTTIIQRLSDLRQMLKLYNGDPVARGAFAAEIAFLEAKLIAAGFSKDGTPGNTNLESPQTEARREISGLAEFVRSSDIQFVAKAEVGKAQAEAGATATTSITTTGASVVADMDDTSTKADAITADLKALSGYVAADNTADLDKVTTAVAANRTLSSDIAAQKTAIAASGVAIGTARANIETQTAKIATDRAALSALDPTVSANATAIQTYQDSIAAAQTSIKGSVATIETELSAIKTASDAIAGKKADFAANLATITGSQKAIATRSGNATQQAAIQGRLDGVTSTGTTIATGFATIATGNTAIVASLATLKGAASADPQSTLSLSSVLATAVTDRGVATTREASLRSSVDSLSTVADGAAKTGEIRVDDTVVRLGSIAVKADRLEGQGRLVAPGDASISIRNQTANNLVVGDLTILSDSGGKIRLNGVLVDGNQDINRLNVGGGTGAAFAAVTTAVTQGSIRPSITIRNEFSAEGTSFYNPILSQTVKDMTAAQAATFFGANSFYAPDLVIASGKTVSNPTGSVSLLSQAGSIYSNGKIEANSVSIVAKNGDFVQSYTYGFQHVAGDPQTGTPNGLGIIANGAVAISARYLNINGIVQSGMAERFVTIGTAPVLQASPTLVAALTGGATTMAQLTAWNTLYKDNVAKGIAAKQVYSGVADGLAAGLTYRAALGDDVGRLEFDAAYAALHSSALNGFAQLVEAYAGSDPATPARRAEIIGVSYDIANDRFVVDSTNVRGGLIQIYGQIMNTSATGGALRVLDGYGQIKIANLSDKQVVLGRLDTGEDADGTGRGVRGRIDITDILSVTKVFNADPTKPPTVTVAAKQTSYTRELDTVNPGTYRVVQRSALGALGDDGLFVRSGATTETYGTDRGATYDPQAGLRYLTLSGEDSSLVTVTHYFGDQFFGSADLTLGPQNARALSSRSYTNNRTQLISAATVAVDTARQNDASFTSDVTVTSQTKTYVKLDEWRNCNWWTLCIVSNYNSIVQETTPQTTIRTLSSKADYDIAVDFIGSNTGRIDVASKGSVLLSGGINNRTGTTTISTSAGSIEQASDTAIVTSKSIGLSAAGSVGQLGTGQAVVVNLVGGTLDASAADGVVSVDARSDLGVGVITAAGDAANLRGRVVLTAAGSITGTGASLVQAKRVELTATSGSIGTTAGALVVNTGYSGNAADRPFGDPALGFVPAGYFGLKAGAAGDIDIESKAWSGNAVGAGNGTILVDRVVSAGGNVKLTTPGAILDNNPIQSIDTRTFNDLKDYWASLDLFGSAAQAKPAAVIARFEQQATIEKRVYDQLLARSGSTSYSSSYVYAMTSAERAGFDASLKLTEPTLGPADLDQRAADYTAAQTARYHELHASQQTLKGTFDATTGVYSASTDEKAVRSAGAEWSLRQLAFSLSPGALKTVTGTNPVLKASNVSGRVVTLSAGQGIGEVSNVVSIPIDLDPALITQEQKVALATAERSDFLSLPTSATPNAAIQIRAIRALNFDAATQLNASVSANGGNGYFATTGDARLGAVSLPGELRVKARGSIVNAAGTPDVSANAYILEASGGGIGYIRDLAGVSTPGTLKIKPVNTTGTSGAYAGTVTARAIDAIDISVEAGTGAGADGDANIDTVYSRKTIKVAAAKSIRNANGDKLINVLGDRVELEAKGGSIGGAGDALNVGNGAAGTIDATATGAIHLFAPDGRSLTIRSAIANGGVLGIVAGNALNPASANGLTLAGTLSASAGIDLFATGRIAALGTSSVSALGGDLAVRAGSLRMLTGSGFVASGRIAVATAGDAQATGLRAGSATADAVRITSGGRILGGTAANRIDIETTGTGAGTILSAQGGIGAATVANDTLDVETETAVPNPLRIASARADLRAVTGDLVARFLGDVEAVVRNQGGAIDLAAAGAYTSAFTGADAGSLRIDAAGDVAIAALGAGGAVEVSSLGAMRIGTGTGGSDVTLKAARSLDVDALDAAGAVEASSGSDLSITTLAGRSAVLGSAGALSLRTGTIRDAALLAAGGTLVFADLGAGSASLDAGGALTGNRLAVSGDARLRGTGAVGIGEISTGGSLVADAGTLTLGRAVSGGAQTLSSTGDLVFDHLQTLGISAEPGDIRLTSREASVLGGEAIADRDLIIVAKKALAFSKLRAGRDLSIRAGTLKGRDLDAGGEVAFDVSGSDPIKLATLKGKDLKLSSGGAISVDNLQVSSSALLEASDITVSKLTYTGLDQLLLTLRGFGGGVAERASLDISAPNGITIGQLRVADSRFVTDASNVRVIDGYVPGTLQLITPDRTVWMNNRTPRPTTDNDVQLFRPDFAFALDQSGNRTTTSSYVVRYGAGTDARLVWNGDVYPGSSFVRDFESILQEASNGGSKGTAPRSLMRMTVDAVMAMFRSALTGPVSAPLDGPAVRTSDEDEAEREEAAVR